MSRRTGVLAVVILMAYASIAWFISRAVQSALAASIGEQFRTDFVIPTFGELSECVSILVDRDGWVELNFVEFPGCAEARIGNPILDAIAKPWRHLYREVPPGSYEFGGFMVDVGPVPAHSPGFSICFPIGNKTESTRTLLLNPHSGLGYLPKEVMSSGDFPVDAGELFSHEAGHFAQGCTANLRESKSNAVSMENWYIWHLNPKSQGRLFHDPPSAILPRGRVGTK